MATNETTDLFELSRICAWVTYWDLMGTTTPRRTLIHPSIHPSISIDRILMNLGYLLRDEQHKENYVVDSVVD